MNIVEGQGWPDMVMLDQVNEQEFVKNIKLRFDKKQIYTYIGEQVVVMNPYQRLPLYGKEAMEGYRRRYLYEVQPHVYALADDTFRNLRLRKRDQCVIVTGESGAGKTEAAKTFMEYLAFVSGAGEPEGEITKQKLLDSNPVLEAFGNAKTQRNDNSSRFGKYMEVKFNGAGKPLGGSIKQYLLEKSRVVARAEGERCFHIFYAMLSDKALCTKLGISPKPEDYHYLAQSKCFTAGDINDATDMKHVLHAMTGLGFTPAVQTVIWRVLASILQLGNVTFAVGHEKNVETTSLKDKAQTEKLCSFLGINHIALQNVLCTRKISTGVARRGSIHAIFHNEQAAIATRDTLAKALYHAIFSYVVATINKALATSKNEKTENVVGILDIYGFEIFNINGFEQFCINYCNEKLQQLFIKLVLRSEQEEYMREEINWTPIDYHDNQPIIDLMDGKLGLYKLLDDACMVGSSTPQSLMDKFNQTIESKNFITTVKDRSVKMAPGVFRIKHYAGLVDYQVEHFITKNNDTFFQDLCELVAATKFEGVDAKESDDVLKPYFPLLSVGDRRKRPKTAGTQFVEDVSELCATLERCEPHYIRCIKPNDEKKMFGWNEERIRHQIQYLNLVETVRVRKAGFCNRQPYVRFFARYKCVLPGKWFQWGGTDKEGTQAIFDHLKIDPSEYRAGKTQMFIRNVRVLMLLENTRQQALPLVVTAIARRWRGFIQRKKTERVKAARKIQTVYRGFRARKKVNRIKAVCVVQRAIRCFKAKRQRKVLEKARDERRTLHIKLRAAKMIQKWARGKAARKWFIENKRMIAEERHRNDNARNIQRWFRRALTTRFVKQLIKNFCNLPKPPPRFGRLIPWPNPLGKNAKLISPIFQQIRMRQWARRMVAFFKATTVIQKDSRLRLERRYMLDLAKNFNFKVSSKDDLARNIYVVPQFGKVVPFPAAITPVCKSSEPTLKKMQQAWWGFMLLRWRRALRVIQKNYRKHLEIKYLLTIRRNFEDEQKVNFGKNSAFPVAIAPSSKTITDTLLQMRHLDWAHRKIRGIGAKEKKIPIQQKLIALDIFRGTTGWYTQDKTGKNYGYNFKEWKLKAPWDCTRDWQADYVTNTPGRERFGQVCQELFTPGGDSTVIFTDVAIKVNRKLVSQEQVIIVTDKNIYKYNAKKLTRIKFCIPLSYCKAIHKSPNKDSFVILQFGTPYRDMVLNMGHHGHERYSELITTVRTVVEELTQTVIPVTFPTELTFNNSRSAKAPGQDMHLTWKPATPQDKWKPELGTCILKQAPGKNETVIIYQ